jgi:hypothetical protein
LQQRTCLSQLVLLVGGWWLLLFFVVGHGTRPNQASLPCSKVNVGFLNRFRVGLGFPAKVSTLGAV